MINIGYVVFNITKVTPKFQWVVLQSFPSFDDNMLELEKFISRLNVKKIILLVHLKSEYKNNYSLSEKTLVVKRRSLLGVYYYIFSKYIFITHGLYFRRFPSNQISVNVWHGMPLKKIGTESYNFHLQTTFTLSTSTFFNDALSNAFKVSISSIINCNLPRNFSLLEKKKIIQSDFFFKSTNDKIILWLPTYRSSVIGDIRVDGIDYGNIVNISDFSFEKFNSFLKDSNLICYLKPHPMVEFKGDFNLSHLKVINDDWLFEKGFTLYDLVAHSDLLISDISSVIVDYLLLDRPIIFSFADFHSYENSRGFSSDFFFQNIPGKICYDYDSILIEITVILNGNDNYQFQRNYLSKIFHDHTDRSVLDNFINGIFK